MIRFFKGLLGGKKVKEPVAEAPYKVETPEAKVEAVNAQPIAEVAEAKPAKSKKAPAKPKAEKKPATLTNYDLTYGSLAGVMIALIYFFLVGLGLVVGAQINAALAESDDTGVESPGTDDSRDKTVEVKTA